MRQLITLYAIIALCLTIGCTAVLSSQENGGGASVAEAEPEFQFPGPLRDANGNEKPLNSPDDSPLNLGSLPAVSDSFDAEITESYAWRNYMLGSSSRGLLAFIKIRVANNTDENLELVAQWMGMRRKGDNEKVTTVTFAYRSDSRDEKEEQASNTIVLLPNEEIELEFITRSGPMWEPPTMVQLFVSLITAEAAEREGDLDDREPGLTEAQIMQGGWVEIEAIH